MQDFCYDKEKVLLLTATITNGHIYTILHILIDVFIESCELVLSS